MPNNRIRALAGFSLIELMIVVAVVAILAAIAIPSYEDSVRKSRRGEAKGDMVDLAQQAERFNTINNTYVGFWATVPTTPVDMTVSPKSGGTAYYQFTEAEAATTFTLTGTPQNGQQKDTRCGTLTLDQTGTKTSSGTGTLSDCW